MIRVPRICCPGTIVPDTTSALCDILIVGLCLVLRQELDQSGKRRRRIKLAKDRPGVPRSLRDLRRTTGGAGRSGPSIYYVGVSDISFEALSWSRGAEWKPRDGPNDIHAVMMESVWGSVVGSPRLFALDLRRKRDRPVAGVRTGNVDPLTGIPMHSWRPRTRTVIGDAVTLDRDRIGARGIACGGLGTANFPHS